MEGPSYLFRRHRHHLRRHRQPEQLAGRHDLHLAGRTAACHFTEGHHGNQLYLQQRRDTADQNRERRENLLHLGRGAAGFADHHRRRYFVFHLPQQQPSRGRIQRQHILLHLQSPRRRSRSCELQRHFRRVLYL